VRGSQVRQLAMLMSLSPEDLIPSDHPIRRIRKVVDAVLAQLDDDFTRMYAAGGRPSVPPEQLLKASVLMALYSIRSERQFCERLRYDLLFKYFLDLNVDDEGFDHSTFSKNQERLLKQEIADRFFAAVVRQAHLRRYLSQNPAERPTIQETLSVLRRWEVTNASAQTMGKPAPAAAKGPGKAKKAGGKKPAAKKAAARKKSPAKKPAKKPAAKKPAVKKPAKRRAVKTSAKKR